MWSRETSKFWGFGQHMYRVYLESHNSVRINPNHNLVTDDCTTLVSYSCILYGFIIQFLATRTSVNVSSFFGNAFVLNSMS